MGAFVADVARDGEVGGCRCMQSICIFKTHISGCATGILSIVFTWMMVARLSALIGVHSPGSAVSVDGLPAVTAAKTIITQHKLS